MALHERSSIAVETLSVFDSVLGIERRIYAGQPVPEDLLAAYAAAGGKLAGQQTPAPAAKQPSASPKGSSTHGTH